MTDHGASHLDNSELARLRAENDELRTKALALEHALDQQGQLLLNVVDSISDLIFYKNTDLCYIGCNQAFSDFLGFSKDYIIGKSDFELFPQEYAELFRSKDIPVLENLIAYSNYEWVEHADGRRLYLLTKKAPLLSSSSLLLGMVGVSRDITEEHHLRDDIKVANQHLVNAQRIAKIGHWEWDIRTNALVWSDEIYRIFGFEPQEFKPTYEKFLDTIHPEDRELVNSAVGSAIELNHEYNISHRIILPDGHEKMVREIGRAVYDAENTPVHMLGTVQDITQLKQVEAKLAEQEEAFNTVYMHSSDGILLIKEGRFIACNHAAVKMLKAKDESSVINLLPSEISPLFQANGETSAEKANEVIAACLERGACRFDWVHVDSEGEKFWVDVLLTRLMINGQFLVHVAWRDISDRKKLEGELEISTQGYKDLAASLDLRVKEQSIQLIKQSRMAQMGEMLSMIAHQWRQPLSSIVAVSSSIKLKIDLSPADLHAPTEMQDFKDYTYKQMNEIEIYVNALSSTIDDFRTLYKPDKIMYSHPLTEPIKRALSLLERSFREHSILIEKSFNTDISVFMHANEVMQVILNLLKNAEDNFVEKGTVHPKILLETFLLNDLVKIQICDNGGGIDEEIMEKIFDPYFSTKNEKNGTGLGLYMCKIIIEQHEKGRLEVKNTDAGACFSIELPLGHKGAL